MYSILLIGIRKLLFDFIDGKMFKTPCLSFIYMNFFIRVKTKSFENFKLFGHHTFSRDRKLTKTKKKLFLHATEKLKTFSNFLRFIYITVEPMA